MSQWRHSSALTTRQEVSVVTPRVLAPSQAVQGRPFTSPRLYQADRRALSYMLHDLKCLIDAEKVRIDSHSPISWSVNGLARRVIVCDYEVLTSKQTELCLVGFFGERHIEQSSAPLEEANAELVLEFRNYPGILSYSSMELFDGNWANLVIHDLPRAREYWRSSERHAEAANRLSPKFYQNVRIHNGVIPGGLSGGGGISIQTTKYWDYRKPRVWQAIRDLTHGQVEQMHATA